MGNDLPDYQSQVIGVGLEATAFRSGLDADKPASPAAGDIWLARDTYYLYVCFVAGSWEKVAKLYLPLAGGTMSGAIAMGSSKITGLAAPTANADAARKLDVDTVDAKLDDVSVAQPTRVLNTIYQNTGGKTRLVVIQTGCQVQASGTYIAGEARIFAYCASSTPPTTLVTQGGWGATFDGLATGGDATVFGSLVFFVPPNYYYKLETSISGHGLTPTLGNWTEYDLF